MSSLRSFFITLVASILLFSFAAYYATQFVTGLVFAGEEEITTPVEDTVTDPADPAVHGVVNLLLVCTDQYVYQLPPGGAVESQFNAIADAELRNRTTTIEFMTLVSFNSNTQEVVITALPDNLLITANGTELDLDSAYYFSQNFLHDLTPDFFVQAVSALLGIQVSYTAYIDIDQYVRGVDRLGGLAIDCPEAVPEFGITKGEQIFTANQLHRMIQYDDYKDPDNKTLFLINQCHAFLERITDEAHAKTAYADFERISKLMTTDFNRAALTEYKDLIFSYSRYTVQMPLVIGKMVDDHGTLYFSPDRIATRSLFRQFK